MIDTKELRKRAEWGYNVASAIVIELLDRLESAEKDIALKERVIDSLGSELNAVANERDALRTELAVLRSSMTFRTSLIGRIEAERDALQAKVEAMEKQEPVGKFIQHPSHGMWEQDGYSDNPDAKPLYLAPGAQTQGERK